MRIWRGRRRFWGVRVVLITQIGMWNLFCFYFGWSWAGWGMEDVDVKKFGEGLMGNWLISGVFCSFVRPTFAVTPNQTSK